MIYSDGQILSEMVFQGSYTGLLMGESTKDAQVLSYIPIRQANTKSPTIMDKKRS